MRRFALATVASFLLIACQNGTVTLSVADAPIDGATSAVIEFTSVDLIESDGSSHSFDFDPPASPDLLSATSKQLLSNVTVPAGSYKQITLHVSADGLSANSFVVYPDSSTISRSGTQRLELSTTDTDAVDIPATFSVTRLRNTALTADFDLRKSILNPESGLSTDPLVLDPQVRVVVDEEVGTLTGTVAASLVATGANCSPAAIYVYQGSTVAPGDEGGSNSHPFTSTIVPSGGSGSGFVSYTVGFLPPGTYTVALICNPEVDDPKSAETLVVFGQQNVSISAGAPTTALPFGP
jgi:hypothetical protein